MDEKVWEKIDSLIDANQTKTIKELFASDPDRAKRFRLKLRDGFSIIRRIE